jgi:molybdate transport system ATP-binding protein
VNAVALQARLVARVGVLDIDVELDTAQGTLAVVGPNGAGKSSLLGLLLGALPLERGRVAVGTTVLHDTEGGIAVPLEQRRLGYVPQHYALFPHLTVRQNVEFALESAESGLDKVARASLVRELLAGLGLSAHGERRTRTLSGGEQQRVALARALSIRPRALLLDEPLAALDASSRHQVRSYLAECLARLGLPTIVVTHDAADARQLAHRVAVLEAGRIVQLGSWAELCARPASRFVEQLVSASEAS